MSSIIDLEHSVDRRQFLHIMGASLALAGLNSCTKMPAEKIIPYVIPPENFVPGISSFFASAADFGSYVKGILVESHEGRPTKIEGNPRHPFTQGKSDIFVQGELLQLYDPERAKSVTFNGQTSSWQEFRFMLETQRVRWAKNQGAGVRILSPAFSSPTMLGEIEKFLRTYPEARWHHYEPRPAQSDSSKQVCLSLFGKSVRPLYDFTRARIVLSLDSDFLGPGPAQEVYSRDFMSFRKPGTSDFNRLYTVETSFSLTGACSDHRCAVRPSDFLAILASLANDFNIPHGLTPTSIPSGYQVIRQALLQDLKTHSGKSLILAGEHQPAEVQRVAWLLNEHLGNLGETVHLVELPSSAAASGLVELTRDLNQQKVDTLFILGGNPVYDSPSSLGFAAALSKSQLRIRLGLDTLKKDETGQACQWHLPQSHFLESWGDGRTWDGTATLQQPLIAPLYETRSALELFLMLNPHLQAEFSARQAVEARWKDYSFEKILAEGFVVEAGKKSESLPKILPRISKEGRTPLSVAPLVARGSQSLEAVFRPDPTLGDGRYAGNSWLQELPKPLLQLTWGNAAVLSPATAERLQLKREDEIELRSGEKVQRARVLSVPGFPDDTVTLYLGGGRVSHEGYNAYLLAQNGFEPISTLGVQKISTRPQTLPLATTHTHWEMENRDLVLHTTAAQFRQNPTGVLPESQKIQPTLLAATPGISASSPKIEAWAMVIDLTRCIGCMTCSIACQAENNIPVVGRDEVRRSREMHWIRVDRYFSPAKNGVQQTFFQPVPCMHCEKAPCEEVCPTAATQHSHDGLNEMIYNRCVGTRYCSNNCPYKVRRFNFYQYSDLKTQSLQLMHNPNVTVRTRGVMEKCSYCIQRIQTVRLKAEKEDRAVRDLEIVTACQQACPTTAITFGDQNNPESQVSRLKALPHHYKLLNELGTLPRTTYLAHLNNPNPVGDP